MRVLEKIQEFLVYAGLAIAFTGLLLMVAGKMHPNLAPTCKVCHCGKTVCSRECSEENMCAVKCELDCKRRNQ